MFQYCIQISNKVTRTVLFKLFWCLYCYFWTYFRYWFGVSIGNFDQANTRWRGDAIALVPTKRSSHQSCSIKEVLFKISQNSQKNTCGKTSFLINLQAEAWNFIKKRESSTGVFLWTLWNFKVHIFQTTSLGNCFWTKRCLHWNTIKLTNITLL